MQNNTSTKTAIKLTQSGFLIILCLFAWHYPTTNFLCQYLDVKTFRLLNNSLLNSSSLQVFWGYLNHHHESWLNVCVMIAINITSIFMVAKYERKRNFSAILYFWLFFQIVLFITHFIFSDLLNIRRLSPSMLYSPLAILSELLNNSNIKVFSTNCFPAGHALVAIYWANFSLRYTFNKLLKGLIILATALIILPRLYSGAHWLTDIVFTIFYALFWFYIAQAKKLFIPCTNFITKIIDASCSLIPKRQKI